jgi:hypothetical protein
MQLRPEASTVEQDGATCLVDIGGGYAMPDRCSVWIALLDPQGKARGLVRLELAPKPPDPEDVDWDGPASDNVIRTWVTMARIDDPAGLTSWSQLPKLSALRKVAIAAARRRWAVVEAELTPEAIAERRGSRRQTDDALMLRVVEVYRAGGRTPTARVAQELGYTRDGAAKLVAKARRRINPVTGTTYLPPTTRGRATTEEG